MATLSEQAGRYEDMIKNVDIIANQGRGLDAFERSIFSIAYRNVVGLKRTSWRALASLEHTEATNVGIRDQKTEMVRNYREKIEKEIQLSCKHVIDVITEKILPTLSDPESKVFFHKLKGDYYRYMAETSTGDQHTLAKNSANMEYEKSSDIAISNLPPTHPTRLGLALNFSVFYYEVMAMPERACLLSKAAFDDSLADISTLDGEQYKDAAATMQLLRDNLTLWTSEMMPRTKN